MNVAVVGAGVMGCGIAQAFASRGDYHVTLCDRTPELAGSGKARIQKAFEKLVAKNKLEQSAAEAALDRVAVGDNLAAADSELLIEAATEQLALKKALFAELDTICPPDTLFATNTSSLSITELSVGLKRPLVGMHFFNPVPLMKLVEVIPGMLTPPELVEKVVAVAEGLGKEPVLVQDSAGFVVNRILIPMINEAAGILAEGVATAEDIDKAMRLGANFPMGPLELGDLVGLDVCLAILDVLYEETKDPKYRAHPVLRRYVRAGLLGRKTGRGFFDYKK